MIDSQGSKEELAEERTDTAYERTLLAQERTYSAWVRTGLASVATGFAIVKLMSDIDPQWLVTALGSLFIAAGIALFVLGYWTYRSRMKHSPDSTVYGLPLSVITFVSAILLIAALMALTLVFIN